MSSLATPQTPTDRLPGFSHTVLVTLSLPFWSSGSQPEVPEPVSLVSPFVRKAKTWTPIQTYELEFLRVEPSNLCFNTP